MTKPFTIEIHGTGTSNRGAELMAIAIIERIRNKFPSARLVVPPDFGDFDARIRHGVWCTWEFRGRIRAKLSTTALRYGSPGILSNAGLIDPSEIDVVLDASGFAFSDQWGPGPARHLVVKISGNARKGKPFVLLPQAFGPFDNPEVALWTRRLCDRASLVCARDSQSLAALQALGAPASFLRQYPDFTVGISPQMPPEISLPNGFSAIVPNIRMMDKGFSGPVYLDFISRSIRLLQDRGMNPAFVLHDAQEDRKVINQLRDAGHQIPVIEHHNPRALKAILGRATLVVGSRFHALVSTLSQGVPCIGAGWSHKYPELFADFNCSELLIKDLSDPDLIERAIDSLAIPSTYATYRDRITTAASCIKKANQAMWQEVEGIIERAL